MSDYYMGQIVMTGFPFAPRGFAQCNGALLAMSQYSALYSLLGTVYGGDGRTTFALPDLRGRTPIGGGFNSVDAAWQPPTTPLGAIGGVETVSLTPDQNGPHTHGFTATQEEAQYPYADGSTMLAQTNNGATLYGAPTNLVPLGAGPSTTAGIGAPHANMQPFSVINFNIALSGYYPSRS